MATVKISKNNIEIEYDILGNEAPINDLPALPYSIGDEISVISGWSGVVAEIHYTYTVEHGLQHPRYLVENSKSENAWIKESEIERH